MKRVLVIFIAAAALLMSCQSMGGEMEEATMQSEESMEEEMDKDDSMGSMEEEAGM